LAAALYLMTGLFSLPFSNRKHGGTALSGAISSASRDVFAQDKETRSKSSEKGDGDQDPRIDVHHHMIAPLWAAQLAEHGGDSSGWELPKWTP
jgi:hypothetical protein